MGLLLDERASDHLLDLRGVPGRVRERTISYMVPEISLDELVGFCASISEIRTNPSRAVKAVHEYLLERFFRDKESLFDRVIYYHGQDGAASSRREFVYTLQHGGRSIKIARDGEDWCEIPRLVSLKKGREEHIIICEPITAQSLQKLHWRKLDRASYAVKVLLNGIPASLSHMLVMAQDTFNEHFMLHGRDTVKRYLPYMWNNPTNLCLVYSLDSAQIELYARNVNVMMGKR